MQPDSFLKCSCETCQGHIEFPEEGLGQSIACPHCGSETLLTLTPVESLTPKRNLRIPVLFLIVFALAGATAVGIFLGRGKESKNNLTQSPVAQAGTEPTPKHRKRPAKATLAAPAEVTHWDGLETSGATLQKPGGRLIYALGTVRNASDRQRFGVQVTLDLFDKQGTKIGVASDYTQVIDPHKEWSYKALVTEPKVVRAQVSGIREK